MISHQRFQKCSRFLKEVRIQLLTVKGGLRTGCGRFQQSQVAYAMFTTRLVDQAQTGFVRRRKRRETRPKVEAARTAEEVRKEPQPESPPPEDAPTSPAPVSHAVSHAPVGDAPAGDAATDGAPTGDTPTRDAPTGDSDAPTSDAPTGDARAGDATTGDTPGEDVRTSEARTGDADTSAGLDERESVKGTAEPGGSAGSGFARRKKRHVRGLRRR